MQRHKPTKELRRAAKMVINQELWRASAHGELLAVQMLLAGVGKVADVNYSDEAGFTPLMVASLQGHVKVVNTLLEVAGIRVNTVRPKDGQTALHLACAYTGNAEVVGSLIRAGADYNQVCADRLSNSPLFLASSFGRADIVNALLEAGALVNYARPADGSTALFKACDEGFLEIVQSLIRAGASVNQTTANADSPLLQAASKGHAQVIVALVEAGASVNFARNKDGCTALLKACQKGFVEVVRCLLAAGADTNQTTTTARADSPLIQAASFNHVRVVDELVAAGVEINYARPKDGITALLIACEKGFVDVVRSLLAAGADPRLPTLSGWTPLATAKFYNFETVVALLELRLAEALQLIKKRTKSYTRTDSSAAESLSPSASGEIYYS